MGYEIFLLPFHLFGKIISALLAAIKHYGIRNPFTFAAICVAIGIVLTLALVYSVFVCIKDFKRKTNKKIDVDDVECGEVGRKRQPGKRVSNQQIVEVNSKDKLISKNHSTVEENLENKEDLIVSEHSAAEDLLANIDQLPAAKQFNDEEHLANQRC